MTRKLCISVLEAAEQLSVGRNHLYKYIESGELPSLKMGQRRLINREALDKFRMKLEEQHTTEIQGGS